MQKKKSTIKSNKVQKLQIGKKEKLKYEKYDYGTKNLTWVQKKYD